MMTTTRRRRRRRRRRDREARARRLEREIERISRILAGRPDVERVILFGSLARGEAAEASDIDIAVVQKTNTRFLDRLDEMYRLLVPEIACDILVYTPEEFDRLTRENAFVSRIAREGRVLHAARPAS